MPNWDMMCGAIQNAGLAGIQTVIHIRHPETNKAMCNAALSVMLPIGRVLPDDLSLHPACADAWRVAKAAALARGGD